MIRFFASISQRAISCPRDLASITKLALKQFDRNGYSEDERGILCTYILQ